VGFCEAHKSNSCRKYVAFKELSNILFWNLETGYINFVFICLTVLFDRDTNLCRAIRQHIL
jgi:hypothetical protein